MKKIKSITFVIASLGGGGAEKVLLNLANYLLSKNIEINILYSMEVHEQPSYFVSNEIKIHKLPSSINSISNRNEIIQGKINTFLIIKHLRKKFKELNPDVIVSFMDKTNIYSIIAYLRLQMPLIISERISYDFLQSKIWKGLRRVVYPFSDGMVVLSKYDYDKYTFVKNKKVIFNPIDTDCKIVNNFNEKEKIILAVGRLDNQKGFDMLIQAISMIDIKDWKVLILGDGAERENLNNLIEHYNLQDRISLLGRKDNINDYYQKASIFVLSSRFEGFPNALAEAMSFGCACVSFDCKTGPSDIIENATNGILIEEGNIELLSKNIELLINNDDLRKTYFNEAIKIKDQLDIELIVKQWEDYFEELINQ